MTFKNIRKSCIQSIPNSVLIEIVVSLSILIGIFFRFYRLGFQELWYDELFSTVSASEPSLVNLISNWLITDGNPPGYGLLLWIWLKLFPATEFFVRLPSAIFSSFTLILFYYLAKKAISKRVSALATILFAFSFGGLLYAQEARNYGLLILGSTITTFTWWYIVHYFQNRSLFLRYLIVYFLSLICLSYIHYFGILFGVIFTSYLFLLSLYHRRNFIPLLIGIIFWFLFYLPWLNHLLFLLKIDKSLWQFSGFDTFKGYFTHLLFANHPVSKVVTIIFLITAFVAVILRILSSIQTKGITKLFQIDRYALYYTFGMSIAALVFLPFAIKGIDYRHFMVFFPLHFIFIGIVFASLFKKRWVVVISLMFGISLLAFYFQIGDYYNIHKQQWGTAVKYVLNNYNSDSVIIILGVPQQSPPVEYLKKGEIYQSFYIHNLPFFQYYFDRFNEKKKIIELKVFQPKLEIFKAFINSLGDSGKSEIFILGGHHLKLDSKTVSFLENQALQYYEETLYSTKLYWYKFDKM